MTGVRHTTLSTHWKALFGGPVRRISLDAGLSCPNRAAGGCVFCDPASFAPSAGDRRPVGEQLAEGIERGRAKGLERFAAYFQPGTNTDAPLIVLKRLWDEASAPPEIVALCVGTRPDRVAEDVLDLLATYSGRFGEIWLELGLQSSHDATLAALGRGHSAADFADAARRAAKRGLKVCAHLILGLPCENEEMELQTARFLSGLPVAGIKLHQLSVVRGTPLEEAYLAGRVGTLSEEEYVARAVAFLDALTIPMVLHRLVGDSAGDREIAPLFNKGRVQARVAASVKSP